MGRRKGSLNRRVVRGILTCLSEAGKPLSVSEIVKRTGLSWETACRALKVMRGKGLLTVEVRGRLKLHSLTPPAMVALLEMPFEEAYRSIKGFLDGVKRYNTVFEEFNQFIKQFNKQFNQASTVIGETLERVGIMAGKTSKLLNLAAEFINRHVKEFERLRVEFDKDGIDFGKLPIQVGVFYIFILNRYPKGFEKLRSGGYSTIESLKWAEMMEKIMVDVERRTVVGSEWALPKRRRLKPHPIQVLRKHYYDSRHLPEEFKNHSDSEA